MKKMTVFKSDRFQKMTDFKINRCQKKQIGDMRDFETLSSVN